jgi:predicted ATP-dependent endonuclease of OLD family
MILACEEPELYQHPPQIRHLADVLEKLTDGNNQVVITTHSPLFVNGEGFENTRVVHHPKVGAYVHGLTNESLCKRIQAASGVPPKPKISGMLAKINQSLQPGISEMFFASVPILVEGLEDVSYITTYLHLSGRWSEFRKLGCHLVPANCKDKIITPLAILTELDLPAYVLFDADGDTKREDHRKKHEIDNRTLISLLRAACDVFPTDTVWGSNFTIWPTNLTEIVRDDFGENYERITEAVRLNYAQESGLEKNDLFIAEWVSNAYNEKLNSPTLDHLCNSIIEFARSVK